METQNKPLTKETNDYSNESGFSFGFVCDCCGMEWVSPLKPYSGGDRTAEYRTAFDTAAEKAMRFFSKCSKCGNRVCDDCFLPEPEICIRCECK